jgi:hypothetical protein
MAQAAVAFVTDVAQPYGADFAITYNGDLALVQDTLQDPAATRQQLERLVLTSPTLQDVDGLAIGRPDNLFDGSYGAGMPVAVGEPITPALLHGIEARILQGIAQMPSVAQSPLPVVTVTQGSPPYQNAVFVTIECQTVSGQTVTVPSLALNLGGSTQPTIGGV